VHDVGCDALGLVQEDTALLRHLRAASRAHANSSGAQHHYAERWVSFAYERGANGFDTCTVDAIGGRMTAGGYSIVQLIVDLTQTESFRVRAMGN
jgi:hypothetical protein